MANGTKYLMSMGELKRKDNSIVFHNDKGNSYLPVESIKEIYCMNEIALNTKFLDFCAKARITLHFFNYYGYYSGTFYPKENLVSGKVTVKQVEAFLNNRNTIAKLFVQGIADNIYEVLYHYYRHDKKEVQPTIEWIRKKLPEYIKDENLGIKQILRIEGEIWQRFYENFKYILPEDFILNKRVKRPPDNPINALISFGNSILYSKTVSQIYNTHLNQTISYLHEPSEGRFSLSLDLSEVFKPAIVYRTIFELVNTKQLQVSKHFDKKYNYCLLNEQGKKVFIQAIEQRFESVFQHAKLKRKITYKSAIKLDGYKLEKYVVEGIEFKPFSLKNMI
ncbi:type I-B CRISPR-associated endonuclease Cas1b [Clostridium tyrobutyricum]|uniref:type I-B CRISPR-associated endonuclease Cas1b n=1 Tax=Clostridium tyrobutyricum TaxID=1519 RepID=UPI0002DC075C|nr:type I-B CRISPR-associated endonuclease Cas1b [Clostridium tyrobutyricum]MBV4429620.1 type I-B CRISPR-associated endonuclease Cas1b [Clostridium tyrobutyricum]MBV4444856.1 type I-B CRISPR-associated endonuclease Cas1b [Clostridium tyrobutyricum]MEA5007412.1 type I-B CRISPR-associated endonuclease Cas1b [Clostridium tyrobutyricum]